MVDLLRKICDDAREEVKLAKIKISEAELEDRLRSKVSAAGAKTGDTPRGFESALKAKVKSGKPAVIAEIKRASPSKGLIRDPFVPSEIAKQYSESGAACLSVLTERRNFLGHKEHLIDARKACALPILRKDFIVDSYQILESRYCGADAILLIVAALTDEQLEYFETLALSVGLDVLIEIHDRCELDRALMLKSPLLGVNNRNLRTFEVDLRTTLDLLSCVPPDRLLITESGLLSPSDVAVMRENGVHGFLVGEAFMRDPDPGKALRTLFTELA